MVAPSPGPVQPDPPRRPGSSPPGPPARPAEALHSDVALLVPDGAGLRRLGPVLHPLSRQAPPAGARRFGGGRVPQPFGRRATRFCLDPDPGPICLAVPGQPGSRAGVQGLVAALLYGTGMRLMEGLRLGVKDVEFERREIVVRDGKGGKDRVTVLPENLVIPMQEHLARRRAEHQADPAQGFGTVWLPDALSSKYPAAATAWGWQWVFAGASRSTDPRSGEIFRHHLHEHSVQRAVYGAAKSARVSTSLARRTCCAIRSRRTCCKRDMTSARSRSSLAMPTCAPR